MNRVLMLHWAEAIDSYRIFPRLFLLGCFFWAVQVTHWLLDWYTHLPKDERGPEATGFASIAFVAVLGFLKLVYSQYAGTSRDWNQQPASSTVTVEKTTVVPTVTP